MYRYFDCLLSNSAGNWDIGAAGAGMSDMCRLDPNRESSEIFVMAMVRVGLISFIGCILVLKEDQPLRIAKET